MRTNWSRLAVALTIFAMLCFVAVQQSRYKGLHHWFNYQPMPLREGLTQMSDDNDMINAGKTNIHTFGIYTEFKYKTGYEYDTTTGSTKNTLMKIELRQAGNDETRTLRTLYLKLKQDGKNEGLLDIYLEDTINPTNNLGPLNATTPIPSTYDGFPEESKIIVILNKTDDGMYSITIRIKKKNL